jgi:hypothetical protein
MVILCHNKFRHYAVLLQRDHVLLLLQEVLSTTTIVLVVYLGMLVCKTQFTAKKSAKLSLIFLLIPVCCKTVPLLQNRSVFFAFFTLNFHTIYVLECVVLHQYSTKLRNYG